MGLSCKPIGRVKSLFKKVENKRLKEEEASKKTKAKIKKTAPASI